MSERGQGFFIPPYQREYSWDEEHIFRLFDDINHGIGQLLLREDAATFIGTFIGILANEHNIIEPMGAGAPGRIMIVIDGQQRLTTLTLVSVALHQRLTQSAQIYEESSDSVGTWLRGQCAETLPELLSTIVEDRRHGDNEFRWCPRIIRAYSDKWSRKRTEAQYQSPIARLLHSYGQHAVKEEANPFRPSSRSVITDTLAYVDKTLGAAVEGSSEDIRLPDVSHLATSENVSRALFGGDCPGEVAKQLSDEALAQERQIFRLLVVARFMLYRVAATIVTATTEDYAFDMFESLNTTGEPLTAFETFRPKVIQTVGQDGFRRSRSETFLAHAEDYLHKFKTAQERQRATNDLLIPFALAESGRRLSRRPSEQRSYLRLRYDGLTSLERESFLEHMGHIAQLLQHAWDSETVGDMGPALKGLGRLTTDEQMCFDILQSTNHTISIAALTRFYSARLSGDSVSCGGALRAVTAFLALWRGAKGGTAGIDNIHRVLLREGNQEQGIAPLARVPQDVSRASRPQNEMLEKYFRLQLDAAGIGTRKAWVERASSIPIYAHNQQLTRFLLLAANHDTVVEVATPALIAVGKAGVLPLLTYEQWNDRKNISVEHVAPRKRDGENDWSPSLYEDLETIDCLGNLILLPAEANSSISNRSWPEKHACYRILAAQTPAEQEHEVHVAQELGIDLPQVVIDTIDYLPIAATVANLENDWDVDVVAERSKMLCALAWDRIAPWLGYEV